MSERSGFGRSKGLPMPLLLCPNDNGAMQTVQRSGVEFDICPTCRGVWLDRGELEKLMAASSSGPDLPRAEPAPIDPRPPQQRFERSRGDYDDDDHRGGRGRKRSSIFDIFD